MYNQTLFLEPQEELENHLWNNTKCTYEVIRKFLDGECCFQNYKKVDRFSGIYPEQLAKYLCMPTNLVKQLVTLENEMLVWSKA